MKVVRLLLFAAGIAVFLLIRYFATSAPPEAKPAVPPTQAKNSQPATTAPVITRLEFQGKTVTIKTGPRGPVYEVKSKDGKVLAQDLSEKELQARDPQLHKLIQTAIGSATLKDGRVIDARVNAPSQPKPAPRPSDGTLR
jgi:hypothetical protein